MKKVIAIFGLLLVGAFVFGQERVSHFNSIAEDGQRYLFIDGTGNIFPAIIVQNGYERGFRSWHLNYIKSTDRIHNVIEAFCVTTPDFDDYYNTWIYGGMTFRHLTNDVWSIFFQGKTEYYTFIKAEGFWAEAYLDATS